MQGLRVAACSSSPRELLLDSLFLKLLDRNLEPLRIPRRLPAPVRHDTDDDKHDEEDPFEQREELGEEARSRDAPPRRRFLRAAAASNSSVPDTCDFSKVNESTH
jgi:hypothetical protein